MRLLAKRLSVQDAATANVDVGASQLAEDPWGVGVAVAALVVGNDPIVLGRQQAVRTKDQ